MEWIIIIILLMFNGVFSCMEMAFASANVPLVRDMASKGNTAAKTFINLRQRPERTFAVIQVGITLVGILSAALGGVEVEGTVLPFLQKTLNVSNAKARIIGIALFVIPFTFFSVVVGELVPKAIAIRCPEDVSLASCRLLTIMTKVTMPVVRLLEKSTVKVLSLLRIRAYHPPESAVSELSLKSLSPFHRDYMLNLFALRFKKASEIMVPFSKAVTIHNDMNKEEILKIVISSGHTRIPVLSNDMPSQVIGILHTKEFVAMVDTQTPFSLSNLIREPYFVDVNDQILGMLKNFQRHQIQMAIVRQDGHIKGIITLENILEEIVGEIYDEDDDGIVKRIWSQRITMRRQKSKDN
ncbi:MAG: hemolysin family protein [Candidatus Brocadiaceae bacterium]|nr:hemolysin family protein [Candidatus Brocadiaceae bacterium]